MASNPDLDELDRLLLQLARQVWSSVREKGFSGLSLMQMQVLKRSSEQAARAGELAAQLRVTPAAITKIVDQLVDRGLITRTRSPEDGRSAALVASAAGKAALDRSRRSRNRTLRVMLGSLTKDETAALTSILRRAVALLPDAWRD